MRRSLIITLTILPAILAASLAWAGPKAPGDMKLVAPAAWKATKPAVPFSHAAHAKDDCTACHHTWDGKGAIQSCAVPGCHDQEGKKGEHAFYTAFHSKGSDRSCLGCHKTANQPGGKAPLGCKDCHTP